ncbi:MAG: purine-binding chemotaxis protein CheW [Ignavibacteria bacterium]|jgi:purine-binding chemotaxis protein CheW|nr:purine-binding chemotaxis protein CheW [Ignavibacteria bacterium]MCU7514346.1 purine-binding chemotaxis protein CheW [Ignavibacteria bacterium]MCU7522295.1 purine-binding chemotaxis protein CheW [Ignavibacteria bacterium]MCU7526697.1 purine-binding chemotaxis protein CheW [Ignavibacteria bacterium]
MEKAENKDEILQLVSFKIGNEEFGVNILKVQEIIRMIEITQMPNSPEFVDGVINLRGRVIPVISLRKKLGLQRIEHDRNSRTIVVEICGRTVGFIVDSVSEVLRIPVNITEAPPAIAAGINSDYITSIARLEDRLLILLDLEKALLGEEKEQLQELVN